MDTVIIDGITFFHLSARVDDRNQFDTHSRQFIRELFQIREPGGIFGKYLVIVHVIDIHMDHIARNVVLAEGSGQIKNLLLGGISPAGLMIPKSPELWQRRTSGEPGVLLQNILQIRSV